ncbi:unnamed protein product [Brugia pahangi]|uniref:Uncharacterized protein n=1 Tax=Brugia pahangi TaxID=6280 RepID=A0A0N4SZT1_BRUPA|nr:unnamed protein product [Brugia pahangi]
MILSGTPIAAIRCTAPISVNPGTNDSSANPAIFGELLISSNVHTPHRPIVTIRNLSAATAETPTVTIPGAAEESNFISTNLILNGNSPSAFRPIFPSTSSDSFVITTLSSLVSPSDHENVNSERNHNHHHHQQQQQPEQQQPEQQQQQKSQQSDTTLSADYG